MITTLDIDLPVNENVFPCIINTYFSSLEQKREVSLSLAPLLLISAALHVIKAEPQYCIIPVLHTRVT